METEQESIGAYHMLDEALAEFIHLISTVMLVTVCGLTAIGALMLVVIGVLLYQEYKAMRR